jgi:hypothetical protein
MSLSTADVNRSTAYTACICQKLKNEYVCPRCSVGLIFIDQSKHCPPSANISRRMMQHAEILPIYLVKLPDPAKSTMTYVFSSSILLMVPGLV